MGASSSEPGESGWRDPESNRGHHESEYARLVGAKRFEGAAQTLDELLRRLTTTEKQA